ncbi:putative protein SSX6 [Camelus dromedarius]|uniref:KRAB-related domain-containing protein n=2 Tax=Camelus bactrianus TaxID=9837 RepID=A0A9W3H1U2_CAMBA|nr:putative protein SSX6 [Camelus bactrianus]XP_010997596.1 putative protein SSX6 [Camelus dromedarius]
MKFTACSDWFTVLGPRNCGISSHREAAIRHRSPLRTFDLVDREIQVVFLRDQTNPSTMNRGSSFVKNSCDDTQKLEKKSKAFKDISKYFSKEEWANLAYSQKITYVYMKRNYETMTGLGLKASMPNFMCPRRPTIKFREHDSEDKNPGNQKEFPQEVFNMQERKQLKVIPEKREKETSGSEQAPKQLCPLQKEVSSDQQIKEIPGPKIERVKVWANRLRERKHRVIYEEISDPEEDD